MLTFDGRYLMALKAVFQSIPLVALVLLSFFQAHAASASTYSRSLWTFNSKQFLLQKDGNKIVINFASSDDNADHESGKLFFVGTQSGKKIEGYARNYREKCGSVEFFVVGTVSKTKIDLRGSFPVFSGDACPLEHQATNSAPGSIEMRYVRALKEDEDLAFEPPTLVHRSILRVPKVGNVIVEGLVSENFGPVSRWTGINVRIHCSSGQVVTLLDIEDDDRPDQDNRACHIDKVFLDKRSFLNITKEVYGVEGCEHDRLNEEKPLVFDLADKCK